NSSATTSQPSSSSTTAGSAMRRACWASSAQIFTERYGRCVSKRIQTRDRLDSYPTNADSSYVFLWHRRVSLRKRIKKYASYLRRPRHRRSLAADVLERSAACAGTDSLIVRYCDQQFGSGAGELHGAVAKPRNRTARGNADE